MDGSGPIESVDPRHTVTRLLGALGEGDISARDRLLALIYQELKKLAVTHIANEKPGCGLQATTLVHKVYLRLFAAGDGHFANRRHFFGAAAKAMRRILVEDARKRGAVKRGGGAVALPLETEPAVFDKDPAETLDLEEALKKLEQEHPRAAEIVHLRYFAELPVDQTAEMLGISPRTVDAEWCMARAWLHRAISKRDE